MDEIDKIIDQRRAVRIYDENADYNPDVTKRCVERATLSPNSSNMQLWEFYKVSTTDIKAKLVKACMNQCAARTASELLVVVVRKDLWKRRATFNVNKIKEKLADKKEEDYTKRDKRGLSYYTKVMSILYTDFLGIFGFIKYAFFWIIGFFRPVYRQVRHSDMRIVAHKSAALASQTFMLSMAAEGYDTCPMEGFDSLMVKNIMKLPSSSEINMIISCGIRKPEGIYNERRRVPLNDVYFEV